MTRAKKQSAPPARRQGDDEMASYEIGGVCVEMSAAQAEAWNGGEMDDAALAGAVVHLPRTVGATSRVVAGEVVVEDGLPVSETITLAEALDRPEIADQMDNMPANLID
jgi:hypothetical protein